MEFRGREHRRRSIVLGESYSVNDSFIILIRKTRLHKKAVKLIDSPGCHRYLNLLLQSPILLLRPVKPLLGGRDISSLECKFSVDI